MKKLLLIICLSFSVLAGCSEEEPQVEVVKNWQPTKAELRAMYAAEELIADLDPERTGIFPDYFGGVYADGERCVVLITEDKEEHRAQINSFLPANLEILDFKVCVYSYNYLSSLYHSVERLTEREGAYLRYGISMPDNRLLVRPNDENGWLVDSIYGLDELGGGDAILVDWEWERFVDTTQK